MARKVRWKNGLITNQSNPHTCLKMKKPILNLMLAVLSLMAGSLAAKAEETKSQDAAMKTNTGRPVPIETVCPQARSEEVGETVLLELVVDSKGKPHSIRSASVHSNNAGLTLRVIRAVQQWTFQPAVDARGVPVACAIRLPVVLIAPTQE